MNRFQIEPEENALAGKFGQEFVDYKLEFVGGSERYNSCSERSCAI